MGTFFLTDPVFYDAFFLEFFFRGGEGARVTCAECGELPVGDVKRGGFVFFSTVAVLDIGQDVQDVMLGVGEITEQGTSGDLKVMLVAGHVKCPGKVGPGDPSAPRPSESYDQGVWILAFGEKSLHRGGDVSGFPDPCGCEHSVEKVMRRLGSVKDRIGDDANPQKDGGWGDLLVVFVEALHGDHAEGFPELGLGEHGDAPFVEIYI